MKKINFALVSDVLFFTICSFILTFTAVRYYLKSAYSALIAAIGGAVCTAMLSFVVLFSHRKKKLNNFLSESEKKSLSLHLSVSNKNDVEQLFLTALNATYAEGNCISDDERLYFLNFKMSPLSADDIAQIIKAQTPLKKCVFACDITPDALSLAYDFEIEVKLIGDIYALLKDKNLLPEKYALGKVKQKGFFHKIKKRFNRKLCPPLFLCGLSLLAFSFFTFYPVYYIAFGGALLVLSAISLLISQPS